MQDELKLIEAGELAAKAVADAERALTEAVAAEAEAKQAFEAKPSGASHSKLAVASQVVVNLTRELNATRAELAEPIRLGRAAEARLALPELQARVGETTKALHTLQGDLIAASHAYRRALAAWRKDLDATVATHNDACARVASAGKRSGVPVSDARTTVASELHHAIQAAEAAGVVLMAADGTHRTEVRIVA